MNDLTVLLIDDEDHILHTFGMLLERAGYGDVRMIKDSREALQILADCGRSVVVLDLIMPFLSGTELLPMIKSEFPDVPVIVMTAANDVEKAVECMKNGAFDFIVKPVDEKRFLTCIDKAIEIIDLQNEIQSLKTSLLDQELNHPEAFASFITQCGKMKAIFRYVEAVACSGQPVMFTGETGVGKGLLAKAAHIVSGRKGEFVAVDAAGLDDTMFTDTLFGHEKGAFTGAEKKRDGMIAKALGGTLFLDEIGDLNEVSQVKLLRFIEDRTYYPLGSDIQRKSDARIIVATNKDLKILSTEGRFRKDLYYRLCSHHVHIPPLRERPDDIPLLIDTFLSEAAASMKKKKPVPPHEMYAFLSAYHFPGNIRELRALIYDAVAQHRSHMLSMEGIKEKIKLEHEAEVENTPPPDKGIDCLTAIFGHYPTLKEVDEYTIHHALRLSDNNQGTAAFMLGITRQALNSRLKRRRAEKDRYAQNQ